MVAAQRRSIAAARIPPTRPLRQWQNAAMVATSEQIDEGLAHVKAAPADSGTLELIVRRPGVDRREVLDSGVLDEEVGLVGDNWIHRPSRRTEDGGPHPDMQLNVMNSRFLDLIAEDREQGALAGDQLYVDLDLSGENLPPGTRLAIGEAVIEVTDQPHTGCAKFRSRFGPAALKATKTPEGLRLRLRGLNARVVSGGTIRPGDSVRKV